MAEKEYSDGRFVYNPDLIDKVDITDITGENIQISFRSLQQFVGEIYKDRIVADLQSADLSKDVQFIEMMNLLNINN